MSDPQKGTVTQNVVPISWDPKKGVFLFTLMGVDVKEVDNPEHGCRFSFHMPVLYDIRIRKVGDKDWILGMILPFPTVEISHGLIPGAEYELQTTALSPDKKQLGEPEIMRAKAEVR